MTNHRTPLVALLDLSEAGLESDALLIAELDTALQRIGIQTVITADPRVAAEADGLIVASDAGFVEFMDAMNSVYGARLIGQRLSGGRAVLAIGTAFAALFDEALVDGAIIAGCGEWPGRVNDGEVVKRALSQPGALKVSEGDSVAMLSGKDNLLSIDNVELLQGSGLACTHFELTSSEITRAPQLAWAVTDDVDVLAAVDNSPLCALAFSPTRIPEGGDQVLKRWVEGII